DESLSVRHSRYEPGLAPRIYGTGLSGPSGLSRGGAVSDGDSAHTLRDRVGRRFLAGTGPRRGLRRPDRCPVRLICYAGDGGVLPDDYPGPGDVFVGPGISLERLDGRRPWAQF